MPSDNLDIPDWTLFINNVKNKANLLAYFTNSLRRHAAQELPDDICVTLGGTSERGNVAISITNLNVVTITELECEKHEEADTRLIAHMAYSCTHLEHKRAVVHANDTDIVVLCMCHFNRIENLQELWIQRNNQYLPIHDINSNLSRKFEIPAIELSDSLMAGYVLTGCDTVSYLFRRGKRSAATT